MRARAPRIGLRPALIAAAAILFAVIPGIHAQGRPAEVRALLATRESTYAAGAPVGLAADSSFDPIGNVIERAQDAGGGVVLFSYDGLTGPSRGTEYLSQVGRAAFMQ